MDAASTVPRFVLGLLGEIGAEIAEDQGVYTVRFPPGYKRRFGRQRHLTFDPAARREHVELVESGSPFLKALVAEARGWGGLAAFPTAALPPGTRVYTFRLEAYSSVRKRVEFAWAALAPGARDTDVRPGLPDFLDGARPPRAAAPPEVEALREGLGIVVPVAERRGREFAHEAVRESHDAFRKATSHVTQYFQTMRQDTHLEEARIRKRLGEIQSKLYFTEDGLREIKLQREAERLTQDLHALKKRNIQAHEKLDTQRVKHLEQQRRRYEPKLRIRLISALVTRQPPPEPRDSTP